MIKSQLERKLTLFPLVNIVVANMIGAGIFTTSGLLMENLRNPIMMLILWIVGGVIALCGALSYGELGAAFPHAGGEYAFLSRLYHPLLGFLSGWVSLIVGFSAPIAASAIGFSTYMFRALPQLSAVDSTVPFLPNLWLQKILSVGIIILFTAVHVRGIKLGARVQNGLTVLKIALVAGLIGVGFAIGHGDWSHFTQKTSYSFDLGGMKSLGLSLMWIMFAYSGWNAATYVGSEIKKPGKNLPLSLLLGTGLVTVLYFLLNLFYVYAVQPEEMHGVISIGGLAVAKAFGQSWESLLSILIAIALFSSLSAFIILGPRVYYAMASDGIFFKGLARVHPKYRVPTRAIVLQAAIASLLVLTGTFDQILTYMGFALGLFPLLAIGGVFKLRWTNRTVLKMPGFPVTPSLYLIFGLMILVLAFLERPLESSFAILTVIAGIPVYFVFRKIKMKQPHSEEK